MQAAFGQKRQSAHEIKHQDLAVQPRPFCKFPENDVGRDALAELTEIAEEGKLDVFWLWDQGQRAGHSPDLAPIRNHGAHNRIQKTPHHGKAFVTHQLMAHKYVMLPIAATQELDMLASFGVWPIL